MNRKIIILLCLNIALGLTGCASNPSPIVKQQLQLNVDKSLLEPPEDLITIEQAHQILQKNK